MSKDKLTYESAYKELQEITEQLQAEVVNVDELGEKVKRAKQLVSWCRNKLRETEETLEDLFNEED